MGIASEINGDPLDVTVVIGDVIEVGGQKLIVWPNGLLKLRDVRQTLKQVIREEIVLLEVVPLVSTKIA